MDGLIAFTLLVGATSQVYRSLRVRSYHHPDDQEARAAFTLCHALLATIVIWVAVGLAFDLAHGRPPRVLAWRPFEPWPVERWSAEPKESFFSPPPVRE